MVSRKAKAAGLITAGAGVGIGILMLLKSNALRDKKIGEAWVIGRIIKDGHLDRKGVEQWLVDSKNADTIKEARKQVNQALKNIGEWREKPPRRPRKPPPE